MALVFRMLILNVFVIFVSAFFVATQFFYTLSFIAILVAIILVMMYLLCVDEYYRVSVLKWTGIDLIVAGGLNQKIIDLSLIYCHFPERAIIFKELL